MNNRRTFLRTLGASLPLLATGSLALGAELEEDPPAEWVIYRADKIGDNIVWNLIEWDDMKAKDIVVAVGVENNGILSTIQRWEIVKLLENRIVEYTVSDDYLTTLNFSLINKIK